MSVLKSKRKESQFEVFHYYYQMRREMTDLLLRDFGYSSEKMDKKLNKLFGDKPYDESSEKEQDQYVKFLSRNYAFDEWFIKDERKVIIDYDDTALWLLNIIINQFKVDVSYMDDNEFSRCMDMVFDSAKYSEIDPSLFTGEKFMPKHLDIGNQTSQSAGILYPSPLDNYIKIVCGVKYYGRYMDDSYILHPDKQYLEKLKQDIIKRAADIGIFVNQKKTRIVKISSMWRFLQVQYSLTDTGRIVHKINPRLVTVQRRKMKLLASKLSAKEYHDWVFSWLKSHRKYLSNQQYKNIMDLYKEMTA